MCKIKQKCDTNLISDVCDEELKLLAKTMKLVE